MVGLGLEARVLGMAVPSPGFIILNLIFSSHSGSIFWNAELAHACPQGTSFRDWILDSVAPYQN